MWNKKGDIAMDFLMTYGWTILSAVIVIAFLFAFGVFNSNSYSNSYTNNYLNDYDTADFFENYSCENILLNLNKQEFDVRIPNCYHHFDINKSTGEEYLIGCNCNVFYCYYGIFGKIRGIKECKNMEIYINSTEIAELIGKPMPHKN